MTSKIKVQEYTKGVNGIGIYKSKNSWEAAHPYIVYKGDIRASFKTKKEAENYAKKDMPHMWVNPVTFNVYDERKNDKN